MAYEEDGKPGKQKGRRRWHLKETLESLAALVVITGFLGITNVGQLRSDLFRKSSATSAAVAVTAPSSPSPDLTTQGGYVPASGVSSTLATQTAISSGFPAGCAEAKNTLNAWGPILRNDMIEKNYRAAGLGYVDESSALYRDASLATNATVRGDIDRLAADIYVVGVDFTNDDLAGVGVATKQEVNDNTPFYLICNA